MEWTSPIFPLLPRCCGEPVSGSERTWARFSPQIMRGVMRAVGAVISNQRVRVVRVSCVASLADFAAEFVRLAGGFERLRIALIADEKSGVGRDALLEAVVFGEIGVDRHPLAVDEFLC